MSSNKPSLQDPFAVIQRTGTVAFGVALSVIALLLLVLIGEQTKFIEGVKFIAQPRFWPGLSLIGFAITAIAYFYTAYKPGDTDPADTLRAELFTWLRPLEYTAYFMIYVITVSKLGYIFATLIFCPLIVLRSGYRDKRFIWSAMGFGLIVVLFFKTFLSIKIPGGALYEYFPDAVRNFMILNL
jgi:hypothetical protein